MGASAIEQIQLPNCLCASGIKPTKSQKSEADWAFKLARNTYAHDRVRSHRERRRVSPRIAPVPQRRSFREPWRFPPRTLPGITANAPGHHREPWRFPPRTVPVLSASTRPRIIPLNPVTPHLRQPVEPCHSTAPRASPRALALPAANSPGSFREHPFPHHSPEPSHSTPAPTR